MTEQEQIDALKAKLERMVKRATRASAELRHTYKQKTIDRFLVARAIKELEEAVLEAESK